ncbi:SNF2 family N-terminal domain-containing protein [Stachybotrys elegans]|uniref:SNF2 family N-terminal domain-containing protein n=1 Tax=Stachybotrys elegans TaxID=80388 RepID=A0A8K0WKQ9_9HYPO|nr:SNF2 family N-terminal domain-containing protein [Stachybotrys elegans]
MSSSQEPSTKKPRFFKDEDDSDPISFSPEARLPIRFQDDVKDSDAPARHDESSTARSSPPTAQSSLPFDRETFKSFAGEVSSEVLDILQAHCGKDLERAVNMYFDGTYKKLKMPTLKRSRGSSTPNTPTPNDTPSRSLDTPPRYLGAFGVEGWATRSAVNVLKHGDVVRIERRKRTLNHNHKGRPAIGSTPKGDTIVRFTNQSGTEIGQLVKSASSWVATLIDQDVCRFEGTCIYAPERIRTNETIYIQLKCFLLQSAFETRRPVADDRPTKPFYQHATLDANDLGLRQAALTKLFHEIKLQPTRMNAAAKEGRQGLLKAVEKDEKEAAKKSTTGQDGQSSDQEEEKELEQDQLDSLYKKAQSFDFSTPEAEPADTFALTLRPYQKQALHWMMAKEKDERGNREPSMHPLWEEYDWPTKDLDDKDLPLVEGQAKFYLNPYSGDLSLDFPLQDQHCLGGILADEMGLGKTIQMLSLVHSHRSEAALARRSGITSVNQLGRQATGSPKMRDAPYTTLVVAPMSLISQWQSEAEKASKEGTLKIELYYGSERSRNLQGLCCSGNAPDVVITSYGVVSSEFGSAQEKPSSGYNGIFGLKFFRVIIDEAHYIKNRSSKIARACYDINAVNRWVLTGTPIVNRLEDLFSLVCFLKVEPWNNFSFWRTFITIPFESGEFVRALDVVQTVLEPLVMRRTKDMKTPDGLPLVPLPPKQVDIVEVELSEAERSVYDYIYARARRTFAQNVDAGTVMKAYTTIFAQILRLRQTCCHPTLVRKRELVADEEEADAAADAAAGLADDMDLGSLIEQFTATTEAAEKENQAFGAHALEQIRDEAEHECPLCFEEPMNDQIVTGCWHSACKKCLLDYMKHQTDRATVPKCFNCRAPLNQRDLFEVVRHDDEPGTPQGERPRISLQRLGVNSSSAKIVALISQLRSLRREHPYMKSVVFSQFTSFLSLIEPALARANIKFLRLDGTMAQKARASVLANFTDSKGFTVLLISLRAGGVGLNLTSAGRVFMMDPWWSFAVEAQAIDRIHRMGQLAEVQVKRFIAKGTVEERMLKIQDRKKFLASSLGMMNDEEKKHQRIEDIKELLG